MSTPTDIVNQALRRIYKAEINSLETDTTKEARVGRRVYDATRKLLLAKAKWWFAERRAQLTASATTPVFGYDYAYPVPSDYIRLVSVHPTDDDNSTTPYRLGNQSGDDRVILTDSTTCYIRYIFDLEDVAVMSQPFQDALAAWVAWRLSGALPVNLAKEDRLDQEAERALMTAKGIEGAEDWPTRMAEGTWTQGREDEDDDWGS